MLRTNTMAAQIGIREQSEAETLVKYLTGEGYLPVMRSMLSGICSLSGLPEPEQDLVRKVFRTSYPTFMRETDDIIGDLFLTDEFAYTLVPQGTESLRASAIGYNETDEALLAFCGQIEQGVRSTFDGRRVRGMNFSWKAARLRATRQRAPRYSSFEDYLLAGPEPGAVDMEAREPTFGDADADAARLLVDQNTRNFMSKLAQVGKMRKKDALDATGPDVIKSVLDLGLAAEEYLLTCRQDQHTICVVPEKGDLAKDHLATLRCSVCSRSFPDENIEIIFTLSGLGKKLLDGSLWMSVWVTELLEHNGVSREAVKWGLEAGGDELDLMVDDFDTRVFFELKDREFGLGDAYPFVYRITRYGGAVGLIATMDKVSTDAKQFLEEQTKAREGYTVQIRYFEGADDIEAGVTQLVEFLSRLQARSLVLPLSRSVGIDLWPILDGWIEARTRDAGAETPGLSRRAN